MPVPLVPASVGTVRFSGSRTAWLYLAGGSALLVGAPHLDATSTAVAGLFAFLTVCLGHSVGLHRGLIHGAFEAPRWLRNALLLLFCQTGLGGPLSWIRVHHARDTWQNRADTPPYFAYRHGLARDFVWNLHLAFEPAHASDWHTVYGVPRALDRDPFLRFLEATWRWQVVAAWLVTAALGGPAVACVVVSGRVATTILFHWLIGYASHVHGRVVFEIPGATEVGRDSWPLGAVSFGEGFHNSHHALPRSARMGLRRHDIDVGYWVVLLFERLGLMHDVVRPDDPRAARTPNFPPADDATAAPPPTRSSAAPHPRAAGERAPAAR